MQAAGQHALCRGLGRQRKKKHKQRRQGCLLRTAATTTHRQSQVGLRWRPCSERPCCRTRTLLNSCTYDEAQPDNPPGDDTRSAWSAVTSKRTVTVCWSAAAAEFRPASSTSGLNPKRPELHHSGLFLYRFPLFFSLEFPHALPSYLLCCRTVPQWNSG